MLALSYLRLRFVGGAEQCIRDHKLKQEIELAMGFVKATTNKLVEDIDKEIFIDVAKMADDVPWQVPLEACRLWLVGVQAVLPAMCKWFMLRMAESLSRLADEAQAATPRYDHIVSHGRFHPGLAKKQLLQWPSRDALNEKTLALFNSISDVSRVHTTWALQPALLDDPELQDTMGPSAAVFDAAKSAITLIAALNVLFELSGKEKMTQAAALLEKKKDALPRSVVVELQKASNRSSTIVDKAIDVDLVAETGTE